MAQTTQTSRRYQYISSILAFFLWGGWAFYINLNESLRTGLISGVTQGTASFMITLFLVRAVTRLYQQFRLPFTKLLLPAIMTVCFTSSCLLIIHFIVATPHIVMTILPAITIAFVFCLITTYQLHLRNRDDHE